MKKSVKKKMKDSYGSGMKRRFFYVKWVLSISVALLLIFVIWANLFFYKTCDSESCFNDYLKKCGRAKFIKNGDMIFEYKINGRVDEGCKVEVVLLQGDLNNQDSLKIEGKKMNCILPFGKVVVPESNMDNCHGDLKEGFQGLFISKLHQYIVQNIGEINADLLSGL